MTFFIISFLSGTMFKNSQFFPPQNKTLMSMRQNLQRFKLITFDVTDTLLRFKKPPAIQYAEAAAKFDCTSIDQPKIQKQFVVEFKKMAKQYPNFGYGTTVDWKEWWHVVVTQTFKNSGHNYPATNVIAQHLIEQFATSKSWLKEKGADELVNSLKSLNKVVGVISNFDPRLHEIIKSMELPEFDFVLTSYEVGTLKPGREIFDLALQRCRELGNVVKPCEALHIGNTPLQDYHGAIQAGWASVLVGSKPEGRNIKAEHIADSLTTLLIKLREEEVQW
jgi:REG-2-like HAD superfamily hydrolase